MPKPDVEDGDGPQIFFDVERFRDIVKAAGGPTAVARRADMHLGTLNNYLGGREMKLMAAAKLAAACNVSLDYFATGKESDHSASGMILLQPEFLNSKANFWALFVLLRTCQEYHQRVHLEPTLREVMHWIGPYYKDAYKLPDLQIEFESPGKSRKP